MNFVLIAWVLVALVIASILAVRALGGNITLVSDWKLSLKYYSTYGYLLLAFLPEFWNELVTTGWLDDGGFTNLESIVVKAVTLWVAWTQKVKQVEKPPLPDFNGDGKPG